MTAIERPDAFNEAWCDEHGMTHFGPGDPDCFGFAPLPSPGTTTEREGGVGKVTDGRVAGSGLDREKEGLMEDDGCYLDDECYHAGCRRPHVRIVSYERPNHREFFGQTHMCCAVHSRG